VGIMTVKSELFVDLGVILLMAVSMGGVGIWNAMRASQLIDRAAAQVAAKQLHAESPQ
jgi:hypothetical protein